MGLKLLYIANVDLTATFIPGVVEKIRGQAAAFRRAGFSIDVLYPTNSGKLYIEKDDGSRVEYKGARPFYSGRGFFSKLFMHLRLGLYGSINFNYCERDILNAGYNGIYLRFFLPGTGLVRFLRNLKRERNEILLLLEYPTLNVKQTLSTDPAGRIKYKLNAGKISVLNNLADRIITLTKDKYLFGRPAVFMANGLELSGIEVLPVPPYKDTITLLGVASDCAHYHGYDKIIKGLKIYQETGKKPVVRFRIISSLIGHNITALRKLVEECHVQDLVEFVPPMSRKELAIAYRDAHIGIGTLALHRVGLMDNYSLKHREYAAFGLPFIMSMGDDVFENSPFVLTIDRDEEPVDIDAVVAFYSRLRNSSGSYTQQFRDSVQQTITWDAQLKGVFSVFREGKAKVK